MAIAGSPPGRAWCAPISTIVPEIDFQESVRDARSALRAFSELRDARNAARSRYVIANSLVEIAMDAKATDPTAEQAAREAAGHPDGTCTTSLLFSALQRARSVNFLGIRAFNLGQSREAEPYFREALQAFRRLGDRQGQQIALSNLAAVANEQGDFQVATQIFRRTRCDARPGRRAKNPCVDLYNAALADVNTGNVDRAIERLMLALEWNRELHEPLQDARLMHVLGNAYWRRGDLAQASAFFGEALRLRRTLNDPRGLVSNLRYAGAMAREAGRIEEALQLHREALELSVSTICACAHCSTSPRLRRDSGLPAAIATCREALALKIRRSGILQATTKRSSHSGISCSTSRTPDSAAIAEAESLVAAPLAAALRR